GGGRRRGRGAARRADSAVQDLQRLHGRSGLRPRGGCAMISPKRASFYLVAMIFSAVVTLLVVTWANNAFANEWWNVQYFDAGAPGTGGFYGDGSYIFVYNAALDKTSVGIH